MRGQASAMAADQEWGRERGVVRATAVREPGSRSEFPAARRVAEGQVVAALAVPAAGLAQVAAASVVAEVDTALAQVRAGAEVQAFPAQDSASARGAQALGQDLEAVAAKDAAGLANRQDAAAQVDSEGACREEGRGSCDRELEAEGPRG